MAQSLTLPDFVTEEGRPNQPLDFPKRKFGKAKIVNRTFQLHWFGKWSCIHYDCSQDLAFCHTCVTALKTGKLEQSKGNTRDSTFVFHWLLHWKDVTHSFSNHETSWIHRRALEVHVVITLPQATRNVGELLSTAHTAEKCKDQQCFTTIAENIHFLVKQGISLFGDGKEADNNFQQLLHLRAIDQPHLLTWLECKSDKYTSPKVQNEILTVMGCTVLRGISATIQEDHYYSIYYG